jgi:succinylarginine dihydrolase
MADSPAGRVMTDSLVYKAIPPADGLQHTVFGKMKTRHFTGNRAPAEQAASAQSAMARGLEKLPRQSAVKTTSGNEFLA